MARIAIVAAASSGSHSGTRRPSNMSNESFQRLQRQRIPHRGNRGLDDGGRRGYNRSGSKKSKYGAVDDNEVDADGEEEREGVDDGDELGNETEHENGDPNDQGYEYDDDEFEDYSYSYSLSPSSYKYTMRLYALVPLTAGLTLLFFTLLQLYIWPSTSTSSSSNLSTTFSLLLLGIAFWTVSFALRIPLFLLSSHLFYAKPTIIPLVSGAFQVLCEETLRFASIALAQISVTGKVRVGDSSFSHVWTIALGWAMAEVVVSVWQGYTQLGLYSDIVSFPSPSSKYLPAYAYNRHPETEAFELRAQARSELESLYGVPVPEIPIFISCLLRVDTIMLSIALFLLISFSYLSHLPVPSSVSRLGAGIKTHNLTAAARSIKPPYLPSTSVSSLNPLGQYTSTLPTFLGVTAFHMLLGLAWTPNVLPSIGLHVASYCSCIAALGALFVGLGWWDGI